MIETSVVAEPFEVDDLDGDTALWLVRQSEVKDRQAGRMKLRLAARWCVLHPGTAEDHADWGDGERGPSWECEVAIGGEGTPLVASGAAEEFAAALGVSVATALSWLADALDLTHRLPQHLARVESLEVPVWKPRRVAYLTRSLPPAAAAWVDDQLAHRIDQVGMPTIERTVAEAIAVFCPDRLRDNERTGKAGWHVDLEHARDTDEQWTGSSFLDAAGDTADLTALHDLARRVAEQLRRAGDPDTLDQRKAKALGLIGRGQADDPAAITAVARAAAVNPRDPAAVVRAGDVEAFVQPTSTVKPERRRPGQPTKLYLHIDAADLAEHLDETGTEGRFGHVERLGAATLDLFRAWLGHDHFTLTPVLDPDRTDAVDAHDPPEWMREQVILRDPHCVGPYCHVDSRQCDLDHIEAYKEDGPPGQTHPDGLAPLCRRHHRAKTFFRWRYQRLPDDGSHLWTSPRGQRFLVHPDFGTIRLDDLA